MSPEAPFRVWMVTMHNMVGDAVGRELRNRGLAVYPQEGAPKRLLEDLKREQPEVVILERSGLRSSGVGPEAVLQASPRSLVILFDLRETFARLYFGATAPVSNQQAIEEAIEIRRKFWASKQAAWDMEGGNGAS